MSWRTFGLSFLITVCGMVLGINLDAIINHTGSPGDKFFNATLAMIASFALAVRLDKK